MAMMRWVGARVAIGILIMLTVTPAPAKSSRIVTSWRNPAVAAPKKFKKVLALGMSQRTTVRADFEDALAAELEKIGVTAIPANTILLRPPGAEVSVEYLKEQVEANHIDGVVVSRLVKVEDKVTQLGGVPYTVPFSYYNSLYGYYGTVFTTVYSPSYLQKEKKVRVETNLYAVVGNEGQLVWTGITDTFNPENPEKAIKGFIKVIVKEMQKQGVLPSTEE
jgi:hypothetical protein